MSSGRIGACHLQFRIPSRQEITILYAGCDRLRQFLGHIPNKSRWPGGTMRTALISCALLLVAAPTRSQDAGAIPDDMPSRIIEREHAVAKDLEHFHPIVETYVQVMKSHQGEFVPWYEQHFVSLAEFAGGL